MSLLNVGARALLANQVALQTTGHNIANVSVSGYSRQSVVMETVQGQFTGNGYVGKGVNVATILRNHNELLTRQAAAAQAVQAADETRANRLSQLQNVFTGGTTGLGAAITDMMNSLGDVIAAPTDTSARTVTLTRVDELAARMRSTAEQIREIESAVDNQLETDVQQINNLARSIAAMNEEIARAQGNGQTPNDLLDKRDQLIRELNRYIQTTQVPADDGSMTVFVAGSQALVLGSTAATLSVGEPSDFPGSKQKALYFTRPGSSPLELNESMLSGGEVAGLLRFANHDLAEGRNLLGRMAQAIAISMNEQQRLGLTLDGTPGTDLFSVPTSAPGYTKGSAVGTVSFADAKSFSASDYEVRFTTPPAGQVVRLSDGKTTAFSDLTDPVLQNIDGLAFNLTVAGAAGERVLFKPFADAAANMHALIYSPRDLAAANPINAAMGTSNGGTLQLTGLKAVDSSFTAPPIPGGVTLAFNGGTPPTFTVTGSTTPASGSTMTYNPGEPIEIDGWSITLQGTPAAGDTVTVGNALDPQYGDMYTRNAGNATALRDLRDVDMFDGAAMIDGYANLMARIGTRTQSATYAAQLSEAVASNLEAERTSISGVNLDEEAAKLIQYQQAYQASAKMLQIAQSIFDNLISSMGR